MKPRRWARTVSACRPSAVLGEDAFLGPIGLHLRSPPKSKELKCPSKRVWEKLPWMAKQKTDQSSGAMRRESYGQPLFCTPLCVRHRPQTSVWNLNLKLTKCLKQQTVRSTTVLEQSQKGTGCGKVSKRQLSLGSCAPEAQKACLWLNIWRHWQAVPEMSETRAPGHFPTNVH